MASSSSSHSGNSATKWMNGKIVKFRNETCFCSKRAIVRISESTNNPNRLYFKCETGSCKFFKFWEPDLCDVDWASVGNFSGCGHDSQMLMELRRLGGGLQTGIQVFQSGVNGMMSSIGGLKTLVLLSFVVSSLNLLLLILK